MIEQHDALMKQLRGGREAPKPRAPRPAEPEGVAFYQCHVPIPHGELAHACGKGIEARPYDPVPYHCDRPMRIIGYDWTREATGD